MNNREAQHQAIINYCQKNEFFSRIKNLENKVNAWLDAYPIDILVELKKANAWLVSRSFRYKNYGRFLNGWLSRAAGDPIMRPPSVNEVMAKIGAALDIKQGIKAQKVKVDEAARIRELKRQAEMLMEREKRSP